MMQGKYCQHCGLYYLPRSGPRFCCDAGRSEDVKRGPVKPVEWNDSICRTCGKHYIPAWGHTCEGRK